MDKKKIIYIGILLIVTVLISVTYFSYAFFTSRIEQHGKLNIVAGTLDYQIESNDLVNNAITLESNTTKVIEIKITSLNTINSKYELYYNSDNNIEIGYDNNNDSPTGIINKNESKNLIITIKNKNSNPTTVTFGVDGGLISNNLILSIGNSITEIINNNCLYESGYVWDFSFDPDGDGKGQEQVFTVPCDGTYQLEVWGAQGGSVTYNTTFRGGYGAYATGFVLLEKNTSLNIVVGGSGIGLDTTLSSQTDGGYNGGGSVPSGAHANRYIATGGGATHIATSKGLLSNLVNDKASVLIVAAGGGGGYKHTASNGQFQGIGGNGGGISGVNGQAVATNQFYGLGATQDKAGCSQSANNQCGGFGYGGSVGTGLHGSSGGSGWYGGGGSTGTSGTANGSGGGGSSYIGNQLLLNYNGVRKSMYCYGCKTSTVDSTYTISNSLVSSDAISNYSKTGNGHARITYIGK